jgi:hypothetical protein
MAWQKTGGSGGVGAAVALQLMVDITSVSRADFWEIPCDIYHTVMEA